MISYYGYTISPNQLETGEGFLICRNVPIARTGTYEYMGQEMGMDADKVVTVYRTEDEVFSPAAIASFEGKPVTNDHPMGERLITPENYSRYEKGHAQNVRRGSGEFEDFLVADLHIHDAELIDAIKNGKRQVSCGYQCEYMQDEEGRIYQTNIRGNHIAIVDEGRAGAKAAIMDSNKNTAEKAERTVKMSRKSALLKLFGLAANGKNAEELNQLALDTAEAFAEEKLDEEPAAEVEVKAEDEAPELGGLEAVSAKLDKLIDLLTPAEPEKAEVEVETKEDIDAAIEELAKAEEKTDAEEALAEADPTGEEAKVVEAEEMDACGEDACKDAAIDNATAAYILKSVREPIAAITDEKQRKAVSDALISAVKSKKSVVGDILEAQKGYANTSKPTSNEDVQKAYAQMNPHTRKKED